MDVWMEEGVNRISLGVQSFDTKVRQQVGRIDTGEEVMKRLQKLSAYNQCAVIIDLMYGLPDQTLDVWQEDLHHLVESGVDGADLYQLDVFENSDLHKRIEEGRLSPAATTLMQTEMFRIGRRYMAQWGCKRISHCHWAKTIGNGACTIPLPAAEPICFLLAAALAVMWTAYRPCFTAYWDLMKVWWQGE